jgi:hypothetical protein
MNGEGTIPPKLNFDFDSYAESHVPVELGISEDTEDILPYEISQRSGRSQPDKPYTDRIRIPFREDTGCRV